MRDKIFVTRSSMPPLEEYIEEIQSLWDSCWLTNMGQKHKVLEKEITTYLDVEHTVLLTNGHMALELALASLNLPKGGEVITTPFTFVSTTHAIVRNGLVPVFCDIDPNTYTIDSAKIENLITDRTCAILPVHVYGNICDVERIEEIAKRHGLKVIYDAAHAFGETYKEIGIGNYGDISCFSFHATKVFHTIEGGAVCYKDTQFGERLKNMINFGINGMENVSEIGVNAKMNEFCAAMGICNLRYIDQEIEKRKRAMERYRENLREVFGDGLRLPGKQHQVKCNYAYLPILINKQQFGASRDEVYQALANQGIMSRKYFYPLTDKYDCYQSKFKDCKTPVAEYISESILTLPLYADLALSQVDRICSILLEIRKNKGGICCG